MSWIWRNNPQLSIGICNFNSFFSPFVLLPFSPEPSVFSVAVENLKIRIYKTIILPVVLYGCETLSLTLREEHRLRVFENGPEEDIWTKESGENCITKSFMICTLCQV
jgi:hypothetical protein